jgi:transcriptional regulator with XRE-family HTH domain
MPSFQTSLTPSRRAAGRLVGKVRRRLQKALADRPDIKRSDIARELNIHRSVITRQLSGAQDISVSRVAEIACALGYDVEFDLVDNGTRRGNEFVGPTPTITTFNVKTFNGSSVGSVPRSNLVEVST